MADVTETSVKTVGWLLRIALPMVIVVVALQARARFAAMRRPPARRATAAVGAPVETVVVTRRDLPVVLTGFASVRAATRLACSAEVRGRVVRVHPRLEVGERVERGELLLALDANEYELAKAADVAQQAELTAERERLTTEQRVLGTTRALRLRQREIAAAEYGRAQHLLDQGVGTTEQVETAEKQLVQARERLTEVENNLATQPARLRAVEARLRRVRQAMELDDLNVRRCRVTAPFSGRIEESRVEVGQVLAPGVTAVVLAREDGRELAVSLPGDDVWRWLQFADERRAAGWLRPVKPVAAQVCWLDQPDSCWTGTVTRIENYDPETRTVIVLVSVRDDAAATSRAPLMPGMFCSVRIPGRAAVAAVRLPRAALVDGDTVFVVVAGKLERRHVTVVREADAGVIIGSGLADGDRVVTRYPGTPVDGARVETGETASP